MLDIIETLKYIYPTLQNGQKTAIKQVKEAVIEMQVTIADLESTLARQPLPEAAASLTAKVIDRNTQIEWLVTVREAGRAKLLISAMPLINEWLAEQDLISFDVYAEERRGERGEQAPAPVVKWPGIPNCPDGHGPMKASTKVDGEFYCSHAVGVHPQTQKKLYCMHKAKG